MVEVLAFLPRALPAVHLTSLVPRVRIFAGLLHTCAAGGLQFCTATSGCGGLCNYLQCGLAFPRTSGPQGSPLVLTQVADFSARRWAASGAAAAARNWPWRRHEGALVPSVAF